MPWLQLNAALGPDAERRAFILEAVAVDCFQKKQWSKRACGRLMGTSRLGFDELLMRRGIPDNLTGQDIADGFRAIEKLFPK